MNIESDETIPAQELTKKIDENLTLGMVMRAFREAEELSQVDLAERLQVSKQFLNDVENNRKKNRDSIYSKICN